MAPNHPTTAGPDKRGLVEILERLQLLPDPHSAARHVEEIRAGHPATSAAALAKKEVNATVLRCTGIGVVAGLPGTIPGLGTFAQACATLGIAGGEAAILLRNVARLQYTVAGLYGHDLLAPERIDELLIVAGLQSGAILPARKAGKRVGTKIAAKQFNRHVSGATLKKINTKLGTTVLTKYGTKRGGVALGRMLPFGVGATIGGGVNLVMTKSLDARSFATTGKSSPAARCCSYRRIPSPPSQRATRRSPRIDSAQCRFARNPAVPLASVVRRSVSSNLALRVALAEGAAIASKQ